MIKIVVCDDESIFRSQIRHILENYMKKLDALYEIDEYESGRDLLNLGIEISKYNIIFLDINMNDLDGMKVAKKIREINKEIFIVFVTAFINYTLEGYKVNAVRYILKNNINLEETLYECMDAVISQMNYGISKKTFCFCEGTKKISLDRLLYVESHLHKVEFYIMENKLNIYSLYDKLDKVEEKLKGNHFIRIHQSYLVNLKHIDKLIRYTAYLDNGIKLEIPKARYKFVENAFVAYKGEF